MFFSSSSSSRYLLHLIPVHTSGHKKQSSFHSTSPNSSSLAANEAHFSLRVSYPLFLLTSTASGGWCGRVGCRGFLAPCITNFRSAFNVTTVFFCLLFFCFSISFHLRTPCATFTQGTASFCLCNASSSSPMTRLYEWLNGPKKKTSTTGSYRSLCVFLVFFLIFLVHSFCCFISPLFACFQCLYSFHRRDVYGKLAPCHTSAPFQRTPNTALN